MRSNISDFVIDVKVMVFFFGQPVIVMMQLNCIKAVEAVEIDLDVTVCNCYKIKMLNCIAQLHNIISVKLNLRSDYATKMTLRGIFQ